MTVNAIFWFDNDLRLADNCLLTRFIKENEAGIFIYHFQPNIRWCQQAQWGVQRTRFLIESLADLDRQLQTHGAKLYIVEGNGVDAIHRALNKTKATRLYKAHVVGSHEQAMLKALQERNSGLELVQAHSEALLDEEQLPFDRESTPQQFTPFRKRVEKLNPKTAEVLSEQDWMAHRSPEMPSMTSFASWQSSSSIAVSIHHIMPHQNFYVRGGESAGRQALKNYLSHPGAVLRYKETRNALDEALASTRLSPWLATGCISARQYYQAVRDFEGEYQANDSTYWLIFELLWREFFYWRGIVDQNKLFKLSGIRDRKPLVTFNPQYFTAWSQANTPSALVNALIKQLIATGWMSNRGRQIAASYLINEYQMDWRYGAAFFEKHLIDYYCASNYGNWQYIAGVGSDPRGGRHFNVEKQAATYDRDGSFVRAWDGNPGDALKPAVDAADWPLH